jgi:NAD(P)-dependent dehydrogenase (short-subunit alcohol dehydrogenase family)
MTEGRGRVAVVIGGANGIGAATCRLMAERGWRMAVADPDEEAGRAVAVASGGGRFHRLDVTDRATVAALPALVEAELGLPAALVVSSGAFQRNVPVVEQDLAELERILQVNVMGTYLANRAFGHVMAAHGGGSIVNLGSTTGTMATPLSIYGPSKSAVIGMTRTFAGEWGRSGVRVNSVSPGITLVPRVVARMQSESGRYGADPAEGTALGRLVEPSEVAETIAFLASDRASAITGIDLIVDCGWGVSAGWSMYGGVRRPAAR